MAAVYSAALAHTVTFFMDDIRGKDQEDIDSLVNSQDGNDFHKLKAYIRGVLSTFTLMYPKGNSRNLTLGFRSRFEFSCGPQLANNPLRVMVS